MITFIIRFYKHDRVAISEGDIVLFLKDDASLVGRYQYGIVDGVETGRDGKIRVVQVKYQNSNENIS